MKHVLCSNGTGLMEIVRSLNRSWICDTYFSLDRAIHPGGKVRGEMSGYRSPYAKTRMKTEAAFSLSRPIE